MNAEVIEAIPFQQPSPALLELLQWLEDSYRDMQVVCGWPRSSQRYVHVIYPILSRASAHARRHCARC